METMLQDTECLGPTDQEAKGEDMPISVEEVKKAMESLTEGKTPGHDGLPIEFYKTFWEQIKVGITKGIQLYV